MELNTRILTTSQLNDFSIKNADAVYLGDPFSPSYPGNLCYEKHNLKEAVAKIVSQGKKAYISTFSVPRNSDLPAIEEQLKYIKAEIPEISAIEVHNTGVLQAVNEILPSMPVHMGCLSNIYTDSTVHLLKSFGVERVVPNPELSLEEMELIGKNCRIEVQILIHGRLVLGISEECPVKWWLDSQKPGQSVIDDFCSKPVNLDSDKMQLTVRGRTTLSGKDVCMLEHIPELAEKGFTHLHIDSSVMSSEQFNHTLEIYRKAVTLWIETSDKNKYRDFSKHHINEFLSMNPTGLCNGYYFRTSGSEYVPAG
ncbi:MAG: U32 family peptidase [Firmicutes bacterium]|nr:U32 family peptidase [Bacillota bacterium]